MAQLQVNLLEFQAVANPLPKVFNAVFVIPDLV
jgi:hypothetical protein